MIIILVLKNVLLISVKKHLSIIQEERLKKSQEFLKNSTFEVVDYKKFQEIMKDKRGFIKAFWCESPECEKSIKTETKATIRCLPLDAKKEKGKCVYCGKPSIHRWIFAQAY